MRKKAIVISGYAGAGKDSTANYIGQEMWHRGKEYTRFSLGDGVRNVAQELFAFSHGEMDEYFYNYDNKNGTVPGCKYDCRRILQTIGNEMRELFHPEIWCENLMRRANEWNYDGIIIPDNRYPNELEFFKKKFDVISIRVVSEKADGNVGIKNHPSESFIMETDFILNNPPQDDPNPPYPTLYKQIDELILPLL